MVNLNNDKNQESGKDKSNTTKSDGNKAGVEGYMYVASPEESQFSQVGEGAILKNSSRRPPWFVVKHSVDSLMVAKWPGRLWKVRVIEPVCDLDLEREGAGIPTAAAGYTRAISVKILYEEPIELLFGENGKEIIKIIASIADLDETKAEILSKIVLPEASTLFSKAWHVWLTKVDYFNNSVNRKPSTSPVNRGFAIITSQVYKKADKLTDGKAILEDDEGESYLNPAWSGASDALLHAAMGLGTKGLLSPEECKVLTLPWLNLFRKNAK